MSVEVVRKPPKPVPEKVAKAWREEWAKEGKEVGWQRLMLRAVGASAGVKARKHCERSNPLLSSGS